MTKSQLINTLAANCELKKADAVMIVEKLLDTVGGALADGEKVQLSGFGTFCTKSRAARKGRDPKTGEDILIPAFSTAAFTPSQNLKDRLNRK